MPVQLNRGTERFEGKRGRVEAVRAGDNVGDGCTTTARASMENPRRIAWVLLVATAILPVTQMRPRPAAADDAPRQTAITPSSKQLGDALARMRAGDILVKTPTGITLVEMDPHKPATMTITARRIDVSQYYPLPSPAPPPTPGCRKTTSTSVSAQEAMDFLSAREGSFLMASDAGFHLVKPGSTMVTIDWANTAKKTPLRQTDPVPTPAPPPVC
jgi:hypothetical protein